MELLKEWIGAAQRDEPVWLADVREALREDPSSEKLTVCMDGFDGSRRCFAVPVPAYCGEEERAFVKEYLLADIYNKMAGLGCRCIGLYGEPELLPLLEEVRHCFLQEGSGYRKPVNVARRMCAAFGLEPFRMEVLPLSECPEELPAPQREAKLRRSILRAVERAQQGFYCGIDIGGTDIKLITARDGAPETILEYDWNPMAYPVVEEILEPICRLIEEASHGEKYDGIGVSFPDVVMRDRIVGGETPKTKGMRENPERDYETEFHRLGDLARILRPYCRENAPIRMVNDGHMAAVTAAAEMAMDPTAELEGGMVAFAMGTGLGTGLLDRDGTVPEQPAEYYDILLDLGSRRSRSIDIRDLRCVRNANSGMNGVSKYVGQSSAFRYAWELAPDLLEGYTVTEGGCTFVSEEPDLRKPCLEHIMQAAKEGDARAVEIFRRIGGNLGQVCREMEELIHPESSVRYIFGRFVKKAECFEAIREGCREVFPRVRLLSAGEDMAETPLMQALARDPEHTVAQFGQAVGSIYYSLME